MLLFLMGGLAIGQTTAFEFGIGVVLLGNGLVTLFLMVWVQDFEKIYEEEGRNSGISGEDIVEQVNSWVNTDASSKVNTWVTSAADNVF